MSLGMMFKEYLKLPYTNISFEIINYFLCDILNGNEKIYTNDEIEIIIKSFCYNNVSKYYTNIKIEIVDSNEIDKISGIKNTEGLTTKDTIYLERNNVLNIKNKNVHILRIIFHEIEHISQAYDVNHNEINYKTFLLIMDKLAILSLGKKFRDENYDFIFEEVDARLEAEFKLFDYLSKNCPNILTDELQTMVYNVNECESDAANLFRTVDDKGYEREELLDRLIKRNPIYTQVFPLLSFYYLSDGNKISIAEILKRDGEIPSNESDYNLFKKLKRLDRLIIKNRRGTRTNIERDIESLKRLTLQEGYNERNILNIIETLQEHLNDADYGINMNDLYDYIINKANLLKNRIGKLKTITNEYAIKVYFMMQDVNNKERR